MSSMYKLIESLCKEKRVNMTQMCKDANVPRGNLSDLKMGRSEILSTKNLSKIADYFGVTVDYLLGNDNEKKPAIQMDDELRGLGYEKLTPANQEMVRSLIEHLIKPQSGS